MNVVNDVNEAIALISSASGKAQEEVKSLIEAKKEKFSGLLTDSGATFMIAKELGVKLEKNTNETMKISELKDGMNNIDVIARLKTCYAPKQFEKNGKKGKLQSIMLWDNTGEIRATLWHKDVDKFSEMNIIAGDCIRLNNCSVSSYNEKPQLNLNYNSSFAKEENSEIPEIGKKKTELSDLDTGMNGLVVEVTLKKVFPVREFENDRGKGKVLNFIINQGMEETRATAWNEMADEIEGFAEGDKIRIEGAYTKEGMNGIELHLGWSTRIFKMENGD
ncbi:MAG: hypothetical protein COV47_03245 [Candidatus Diapherotrites archaeon CG11_big_fil_rev_8_21_14_0_20_37_9]|nr:MAG: hypothetical protein COV47_03245 [Candidatus Diapherotrites archaeon CG11_big_fil_rev_8_21_14_0_20_37_9]